MGKRNNSQRKENVESPRKEISENEACNMTEKEFRVMVMEFIHRMDEKINNLCKNQEEMKSDIATIKNTMESFNSRLQEAEDRISELEDQVQKQAQAEQQLEKKIKKQEESLKGASGQHETKLEVLAIAIRQEEEIKGIQIGKEQGLGCTLEPTVKSPPTHAHLEIMRDPDLVSPTLIGRDTDLASPTPIKPRQTGGRSLRSPVKAPWEAQRSPNKRNPKRTTPRHIIIKMPRAKDKERILKAAREKQLVTYKGAPIRLSADFSTETMQARWEWQEIFKQETTTKITLPSKAIIQIEGQIKSFTDKKKLQEFITTKPELYEMLKGAPEQGSPRRRSPAHKADTSRRLVRTQRPRHLGKQSCPRLGSWLPTQTRTLQPLGTENCYHSFRQTNKNPDFPADFRESKSLSPSSQALIAP
ncbi:hypothetical protein QTO34_008118 [Cnephaeus nilssonii]|uniref:Transposase n=1 Tax=Cnephaeus nilssonii TaxID=3371016 RepID=A0AA40I9X2_CNENI|nr:hypothetical protein QTO34_008118 [Eptesicus nilssonii]